MSNLLKKWTEISLVVRILVGLIIGAVLGLLMPSATAIGILGTLFVSALMIKAEKKNVFKTLEVHILVILAIVAFAFLLFALGMAAGAAITVA